MTTRLEPCKTLGDQRESSRTRMLLWNTHSTIESVRLSGCRRVRVNDGRGYDVLVHPEQVGWIELRLQRGEALKLRTVRGLDSVDALVAAEIVHVGTLCRERAHNIEEPARPGDIALGVLLIRPRGGHQEVVRPGAMAKRRGRLRHAIPGAVAVVLEHDYCVRRWHPREKIDDNINGLIAE